jgi:acid stress-induced BolA-like protein IbaG/YrbA
MSRPPFSLSDDQARELVQRVTPLLERYPLDPRDHRPFLRAFIRIVHEVTHKLYGPDIYRRLLRAYAPGRTPSTSTIANERNVLERELAAAQQPATASPAGPAWLPPPASATLDESVVRSVFEEFLPQFSRLAAQAGRDAQVDYLTGKLRETERANADARAQAARLAGELQSQVARANVLAQELQANQALLTQQQHVVASLTEELKGQRIFAMQSIETGRAETRLARERINELQSKIDRLEMTIDQLRMARGVPGHPR